MHIDPVGAIRSVIDRPLCRRAILKRRLIRASQSNELTDGVDLH